MASSRTIKIRLAAIAGLGVVLVGLLIAAFQSDSTVPHTGPLRRIPPVMPSNSRDGRASADEVLSTLKTGMLRGDVEMILGPPSAVDSIAAGHGKLSYRATFNRDKLRPPMPPIILEFDATQPGHPLLVIKSM